jgi:hypothetical protein
MKQLLLTAAAVLTLLSADAQLKTPAPSPTQTVKQDFGLAAIELSYSRPSMKGRTLYKDLAPAGKVWRTGANSATTLTFGDEVSIGGTKIPAGKYGLLSIPEKDKWTLIISKQTTVTSPADYKQDQDVVRVTVPVTKMKQAVETFTIQFANIKPTTCDLQLAWAKSSVTLPISTEIDGKIMANIEKLMKEEKPTANTYFSSAMYYMDNGKDLNQALEWFNKATESNPNAFWIHHQKANCLAKLGKKAEAKASAEKSKELAVTAKNDDYVRLNEKLIAELK